MRNADLNQAAHRYPDGRGVAPGRAWFSYEPREPPPPDELRVALAALDPDAMSPREALEAIYRLQRLIEEEAR